MYGSSIRSRRDRHHGKFMPHPRFGATSLGEHLHDGFIYRLRETEVGFARKRKQISVSIADDQGRLVKDLVGFGNAVSAHAAARRWIETNGAALRKRIDRAHAARKSVGSRR